MARTQPRPPTNPADPADPAAFVPRARPERRFVAAIALVGLVCVGLWVSGAVAPRVTAVVRSVDADTTSGRGTAHIEVRNDGRLPIEVRGISVDDRRGPPVQVALVSIDGRESPNAARVARGQVVRVEVHYTVDCGRPGGYGVDPELGVRVRAPLGVVHDRTADAGPAYHALTGGDESLDPGPLLCPFPVRSASTTS